MPSILYFDIFLFLQGQEFTEYFLLEYQREDDGEWVRFKNRKGIEVQVYIVKLFQDYLCNPTTQKSKRHFNKHLKIYYMNKIYGPTG